MIEAEGEHMNIKELDVIRLKNGYHATILEIFKNGEAYLVEIVDEKGDVLDISFIEPDKIEKVVWIS